MVSLRRTHGTGAVVDDVRVRIGSTLMGRASRLASKPSLRELAQSSTYISTSPTRLLDALFKTSHADLPSALVEEHLELNSELTARQNSYMPIYPAEYRIGTGGALLLYGATRAMDCAQIVETGVADGYSSFYILHALQRNGCGRLVSCDISANAGGILTPEEREAWTLKVLDPGSPKRALLSALDQVGPIDVFVHDSDHSYPLADLRIGVGVSATHGAWDDHLR